MSQTPRIHYCSLQVFACVSVSLKPFPFISTSRALGLASTSCLIKNLLKKSVWYCVWERDSGGQWSTVNVGGRLVVWKSFTGSASVLRSYKEKLQDMVM